tara:strand:- start:582 stop:1043 length:462 start_codon:yes stop_codon:yes gene_type:complete
VKEMKGTKNNKEEERKNILWLTIADKPASSRSDLAKYVKRIPIFKLKALDQKITNLLTQLKNEGKIVNVGTGRKGARYSTLSAPVLSVQSQSKWQKPATPVNTKGRLSGLSKESVRMIMVQTEIEDKVLSQLNNPDEATKLISELIYLAMTKK